MTQATHTPGPWEIREGSAIFAPVGNKPYSYRIADCLGYQNEREANARLIAAAPELLAALERAIEDLPDHGRFEADWYDDAIAAIAKAKGQT